MNSVGNYMIFKQFVQFPEKERVNSICGNRRTIINNHPDKKALAEYEAQ